MPHAPDSAFVSHSPVGLVVKALPFGPTQTPLAVAEIAQQLEIEAIFGQRSAFRKRLQRALNAAARLGAAFSHRKQ